MQDNRGRHAKIGVYTKPAGIFNTVLKTEMNVAQTDRDILFSNEAFVIGMLQAVSGGSLVAAVAQSEALLKLSGNIAFLLFLTVMAVALLGAVLAAYWKHQYKLWDVKAQASAAENPEEGAEAFS